MVNFSELKLMSRDSNLGQLGLEANMLTSVLCCFPLQRILSRLSRRSLSKKEMWEEIKRHKFPSLLFKEINGTKTKKPFQKGIEHGSDFEQDLPKTNGSRKLLNDRQPTSFLAFSISSNSSTPSCLTLIN